MAFLPSSELAISTKPNPRGWLVGIPIADDDHSVHLSVSCKQLADVLFTCIKVEVPTKMFFTGVTLN
jgi:hypothetical protein